MRFMGTLFFNVYQFGFSETYPIEDTDYASAAAKLLAIKNDRLALAVNDVELVGARLSDTDTKNDSYPLGWSFPQAGTFATTPTDLTYNAEVALRIRIFGGALKRSHRFLHAVPKSQVNADGFKALTGPFATALTTWLGAIEADVSIATKLKGVVVPPFYVYTAITGTEVDDMEGRKIGRPFDLPRGRRLIA